MCELPTLNQKILNWNSAQFVKIMLREIDSENWGIRGGQAGCDVELGFNVNV